MNISHKMKHFGPQKEGYRGKRHAPMAVPRILCAAPSLGHKGQLLPRGILRGGGEGPDAVRASPRSDSSGD